MWKVQLFKLNYDERESRAVKEVVDSGWITMGNKTKEFENRFSTMFGERVDSIAVSSCTAALHIALLSLDIREGDDVIIPALTFVADINVVRMVGANPILADSTSYDNWNVSGENIRKVITPKTKAVIIVHFAGFPCEMDGIIEVCKEHNLKLIEDCAHAPGAKYKGRYVGTIGDVGCFSFFTNKNISIGEGGMFVSKHKGLCQKARYFRSHGMTALTLDRHKGRIFTYDVVYPGLNYRIDEIRSALGLVQLEKLRDSNQKRKKLFQRYIQNLNDIENITIPFLNLRNIEASYHIFPILLDRSLDRNKIINLLKEDGIQTSIHYPAFKDFTAFKDMGLNKATIAEEISKRELTLPLYPSMTFEEVDLVCDSLRKAIRK